MTQRIMFAVIFFCCLLKASGEPIFPVPSRDSVTKLFKLLKSTNADTNRVNIFLPLFQFYENKGRPYLDSAKIYVNAALAMSDSLHYNKGQIKSHYFIAIIKIKLPDQDAEIEKGIALSKQTGDIELEALGYFYKGDKLSNSPPEIDKKLEYFKKSMSLYQKAGNKVLEAYVLKSKADVYLIRGDFSEALKEALDALSLYKKAGWTNLHYATDLVSALYQKMGNYEEALRYGLASLKSAEKAKDTLGLIFFYYRFAELNKDLSNRDGAITAAETGMRLSEQLEDKPYLYYIIIFISIQLTESKQPEAGLDLFSQYIEKNPAKDRKTLYQYYYYLGTLNFKLKRYNTAENYYLKVLAEKLKDPNRPKDYYNMYFNLILGNLYVTTKKFTKAKKFLGDALAMQAMSSSLERGRIQQLLFSVDSAEGNYTGAIKHLQLFKFITDSIFNDTKSKHIASLQIQYETDKKEQDIKLLTSENKEQQVTLKQRSFQRNVMIAGIAMLVLLFWLGFTRYRLKQKANLQLKAQQETINHKNEVLENLLSEKEDLLINKDGLIKEKEELIKEKEWLIKEVHHRVKNNLQMVSALLYTQSNYLKDEQALAAVLESQQRIYAISLIHQKLYQSDNLQIINMQSYIHELIDYLRESINNKNEIDFELQVEPLHLDIIKAIPIGLILNEAVTNSLKYAFTNNQKKLISVTMCSGQQNQVELVIKDNGKGFPDNVDPSNLRSLGMNLMQGLAKQIKGSFDIKTDQGVVIIILFNTNPELVHNGEVNYLENKNT